MTTECGALILSQIFTPGRGDIFALRTPSIIPPFFSVVIPSNKRTCSKITNYQKTGSPKFNHEKIDIFITYKEFPKHRQLHLK